MGNKKKKMRPASERGRDKTRQDKNVRRVKRRLDSTSERRALRDVLCARGKKKEENVMLSSSQNERKKKRGTYPIINTRKKKKVRGKTDPSSVETFEMIQKKKRKMISLCHSRRAERIGESIRLLVPSTEFYEYAHTHTHEHARTNTHTPQLARRCRRLSFVLARSLTTTAGFS